MDTGGRDYAVCKYMRSGKWLKRSKLTLKSYLLALFRAYNFSHSKATKNCIVT
jgi:hypothetical protein